LKIVAITAPGTASLIEQPDPAPRDDFAVVRVDVAPTCTEYKQFFGGGTAAGLGHEAAGEVVAVARPGRVRPGDRVVVMPQTGCGRCAPCLSGAYIHCQQAPAVATPTYAQYVLKQDWLLVPVPPGMALRHAALACCGLGPTFGALRRMGLRPADTLVITGLGPVGLGGVIGGVAAGARVIGVESQPYRARLALDLGAEAVVDPTQPDAAAHIRDRTGGGADRGVDCSGSPQGQRLLIDAVRRLGHVAFIGEGGDLTLHVSRDLLRKGLTLHGSWHYNLSEAPALLGWIGRLAPVLDRFITHVLPMERFREAWAVQARGDCGKVLLEPWGAGGGQTDP
jgi:threonine dehydrogenase-like Zn-dependent dehydrogenase